MRLIINYEIIRAFLFSGRGRVAMGSLVGGAIGLMLDVNKLSLIVWTGLPFLFSMLSIWPAVYLTVRTVGVVGGLGIGAGLLWAALFAGLSRWLFGLDEEQALLWVGLPVLIAFIPICIFVLPKHLRKAGIL